MTESVKLIDPTTGKPYRINDASALPSYEDLYSVGGGSMGGLTNAARIAMTFLFYVRPV